MLLGLYIIIDIMTVRNEMKIVVFIFYFVHVAIILYFYHVYAAVHIYAAD